MQEEIDGALARAESVDALLRHLESTLPKLEAAIELKNSVSLLVYTVGAIAQKLDDLTEEVRNFIAVATVKLEAAQNRNKPNSPYPQLVGLE